MDDLFSNFVNQPIATASVSLLALTIDFGLHNIRILISLILCRIQCECKASVVGLL